jgi:YD repeat-containing protein
VGPDRAETDDVGGYDCDVDRYYDLAGRMTRITDDLAQSTDYLYDKQGRLIRTAYEDHDGSPDTIQPISLHGSHRANWGQRGAL